MRKIQELQFTTSRVVYKRLRKEYTCRCSRCPYHRAENSRGDEYGMQPWKNARQRAHQWKPCRRALDDRSPCVSYYEKPPDAQLPGGFLLLRGGSRNGLRINCFP